MSPKYMYRAHLIERPEFEKHEIFDYAREENDGTIGYRPKGWRADDDYLEKFGTNKWLEPDFTRYFASRSSAVARVKIAEAAGYKAVVKRYVLAECV